MTEAEATQIQEPAIDKLKRQIEETNLSRAEREQQERARQNALPFAERTGWRKRHMYRGWQLEPVEVQAENFAITRSNYGYRVLNSPDLGIIDVDFDFGAGISEMHMAAQQMEAIANIRDWVAAHPEQSWRVYRTAAGLRMIRTDAPQPLDETYDAVRDAITEADRLYCDLCKEQNAFRARISPKVHRIGADYPGWSPYSYPEGFWDHSPTQEEVQAYEMKAAQYKVTELLEVIGSGEVHSALVEVLKYHDDSCRVECAVPMETPAASEYVVMASIPELIAFNDAYRPNGMAPDQVWDALDEEVRNALKQLDGNSYHCNAEEDTVVIGCSRRELLTNNCRLLDSLFQKWTGAANYQTYGVLYGAAFEKYTKDAKRYVWVPSPGEVLYGYRTGGHWQSLEESVFPHDPRYWQLESGADPGSAIIRFIPSHDNQSYAIKKTGGVSPHYVANILVVSDPMHAENNGKVFLFRFNSLIFDKIKDMIAPPPDFPDMKAIDVFDMKTGANFKLRAARVDGRVEYWKSFFDAQTPVGDDGVIAELKARVFSLSEA